MSNQFSKWNFSAMGKVEVTNSKKTMLELAIMRLLLGMFLAQATAIILSTINSQIMTGKISEVMCTSNNTCGFSSLAFVLSVS